MLKSDKLNVCLKNFILTPCALSNGIADKALTDFNNPYSYSSSNGNTHQSLGLVQTDPVVLGTDNYPPAAMNSNTTVISNQGLNNGTDIASASSTLAGVAYPYYLFDKARNMWYCAYSKYNFTTGVAAAGEATTTVSGSNYKGEWFQLQLPLQVALSSFTIKC
jgi:hypothetical protein